MEVVIPTIGARHESIAVRALATEGVSFSATNVTNSPYSYGILLYTHLQDGLVVVEHDIVPPPGHLDGMIVCEHEWCASPYPFAPGTHRSALGCLKIGPELARRLTVGGMASLAWGWTETPWYELDAAVYRDCLAVATERLHLHAAVAHCKPQAP